MPLAQLLASFQSLPQLSTSKLGPSGADFWVGLCTLWDPVYLSNDLSCEGRSFSCCHNPHRFLPPEVLRLYFCPLEALVVQVSCTQSWDPPVHQRPLGCFSSLFQLPVSALPTSQNECFFFNFLVVSLPYSSIFCSGCFLFLNLLLTFF